MAQAKQPSLAPLNSIETFFFGGLRASQIEESSQTILTQQFLEKKATTTPCFVTGNFKASIVNIP